MEVVSAKEGSSFTSEEVIKLARDREFNKIKTNNLSLGKRLDEAAITARVNEDLYHSHCKPTASVVPSGIHKPTAEAVVNNVSSKDSTSSNFLY